MTGGVKRHSLICVHSMDVCASRILPLKTLQLSGLTPHTATSETAMYVGKGNLQMTVAIQTDMGMRAFNNHAHQCLVE